MYQGSVQSQSRARHGVGPRIARVTRASCLMACLLLGMAAAAQAGDVTLTQGNSVARIETDAALGMYSWSVDGVDHLNQQQGWFRLGPAGGEKAITSLTLAGQTATASSVNLQYSHASFNATLEVAVTGGAVGSGTATVTETLTITNITAAPLDFHYYQYLDFDVDELHDNNSITLTAQGVATQTSPLGAVISTTVTPAPAHVAAGLYPTLVDTLTDLSPSLLGDVLGPLTGDVTHAYQWDATIAAGDSLVITITKTTTDVVVLATPTLQAPLGTIPTTPNPPVFQWTAVPDAAYYEVEIAGSGSFQVGALTWTPAAALAPGQAIQWRVRGWADTGAGPWSPYATFTITALAIGTPTLQAPIGLQPNIPNPPTFQWAAAANATMYEVEIMGVGMFMSHTTLWIPDVAFTVNQAIQWRVRGTAGANAGPWSAYSTFTVPPPTIGITTPEAPIGVQAPAPNPPQFTFTAAANATSYEIEIQGSPVYQVASSPWTPPAAIAGGVAKSWRVRGKSAVNTGPWSNFVQFTMPVFQSVAPVIQAPTGQRPNQPNPPTFTWTAVSGATSYEVDIYGSGKFTTATNSYVPAAPIPTGVAKWWRVRAKGVGVEGPWSGYASFTIQPLVIGAVTPLTPTGTLPNQPNPPAFTWSAANNATTYEVDIFGVGTTAGIVGTTWTPAAPIKTGQYLYYRVRGRNGGDAGPWSAYKLFMVQKMVIGTPTLLGPSGTLPNQPNPPVFTWTAAASATTYDVDIYGDRKYEGIVGTTFTPAAPLQTGRYMYYRVRGRNGGDEGAWSAYKLFMVQPLVIGTPTVVGPKGTQPAQPNPPVITWTAANNAVEYEVEILSGPKATVAGTTWTPGSAFNTNRMYWYHVRGKNGGDLGTWSAWNYFMIQP